MPIFEYKCKQCEKDFERLIFLGEKESVFCHECSGKLEVNGKAGAVWKILYS